MLAPQICLPDWPWWNRHPLDWLPVTTACPEAAPFSWPSAAHTLSEGSDDQAADRPCLDCPAPRACLTAQRPRRASHIPAARKSRTACAQAPEEEEEEEPKKKKKKKSKKDADGDGKEEEKATEKKKNK